jgi:hypothetical protein
MRGHHGHQLRQVVLPLGFPSSQRYERWLDSREIELIYKVSDSASVIRED